MDILLGEIVPYHNKKYVAVAMSNEDIECCTNCIFYNKEDKYKKEGCLIYHEIPTCMVKGFIYIEYKSISWSYYRLYASGEVYHEDEFEELDNSLPYYDDYFEFKLPENKFIFKYVYELECSFIDQKLIAEYVSGITKG